MNTFLKFLSGKKSTIAIIIWLILGRCLAKTYIDQDTFVMLWGISVALFGSASYATKLAYKK
jgi:hypothetical protein